MILILQSHTICCDNKILGYLREHIYKVTAYSVKMEAIIVTFKCTKSDVYNGLKKASSHLYMPKTPEQQFLISTS